MTPSRVGQLALRDCKQIQFTAETLARSEAREHHSPGQTGESENARELKLARLAA